jgi:isopenicillin-N N-acyltransferase like protein
MIKRGIPVLKIKAENNYDFGYKLGKSLKENIKKRIEKNKEMYHKRSAKGHNFSDLTKKARKFIPIIKKHFPHLLDEARGIADGAEVNFDELLVIICDEEIVDFAFYEHCTSVGIKTKDGKLLLGHNEDWFPEYRKNGLFIVKGRIGKHKFIGAGYIGNLVGSACGINTHLAYVDNSFYFMRFEYKIPRSFHLRALLDVKNPKEAKKVLDCQGSIVGNTTFLFSNEGMYAIEELWKKEEVFSSTTCLVHTNHPLIKKDRTFKYRKEEKESVLRYERAVEILSKEKEHDIKTIKKILTDHKTDICGHKGKITNDITVTLASFIFNPKEKYALICFGNPCRNKYKKYHL